MTVTASFGPHFYLVLAVEGDAPDAGPRLDDFARLGTPGLLGSDVDY